MCGCFYPSSIRLSPLRYLSGQQLFSTQAHQSEGTNLSTDHPVEQALQQTSKNMTDIQLKTKAYQTGSFAFTESILY